MNAVLTREVARQITRGRTPLVPVEYETAVKSLQACIDLNDAKYWDDKADALAAWAKIYRSDETLRKAKMLKLHAFRRMGELAGELKPLKNDKGGRQPGAIRALTDVGLSHNSAIAARRLASVRSDQRDRRLGCDRRISAGHQHDARHLQTGRRQGVGHVQVAAGHAAVRQRLGDRR